MKNIVISGCAILDIIKEIDTYPRPTSLVSIKKQSASVGGCLCNTGIDLKKLCPEMNIVSVGVLGNDSNGDFVMETLRKNGLDVSHIRRTNDPTGYTDVMNESSGRRTFFHNQGANAKLCEDDYAFLTADNCELVHIGYLLLLDGLDSEDKEYGTKMAKLLHSLQERGIKTSIDIVSEDSERFMRIVPPSLKYCSYAIMNEYEGGKIANINPRNNDETINIENIKAILHFIKDAGVKNKVIIHCPELGALIDENNEIVIVNSFELPKGYIKGSVGAGDAFAAGCLLGIAKNYDNEHILKLASCASACNLGVIDSISGATSEEETIKLENTFQRRK